MTRRLPWAAAGALAVLAAGAARGVSLQLVDEPKAGVRIRVTSPFDNPPPCGFAPLRLEVRNDAGTDRRWTFEFESTSAWSRRRVIRSSAALTVPARSERMLEVVVPMAYADQVMPPPSINITVRGPGTPASRTWSASVSGYASDITPYVAVSASMYPAVWSPLEALIQTNTSRALRGSQFDAARAPADARGWTGFDSVWMRPAEWSALDAAQREALHDWVRLGGRLHLAGEASVGPLPGLPLGDQPWGLGRVDLASHRDTAALTDHMSRVIPREPSLHHDLIYTRVIGWDQKARELVPPVAVNPVVVSTVVLAIALLIGPVNLIVLARRRLHLHLFWTTPALSILASLVLFAVIVLHDGFGGKGVRCTVVYLDAAAHKACIAQEQLSRTGVLLDRRMAVKDPCLIADQPADDAGQNRQSEYRWAPDALDGDWFASRSVQGHFLAGLQPTRARVEILPGPHGAPTAVSGLGVVLAQFFYRAPDGKIWAADHLRTGERRALRAATAAELDAWWRPRALQGGRRLRSLGVHAMSDRAGFFYAEAEGESEHVIPTLPSIRWTSRGLLYFGPVAGPAPEASP